MTPVVVAPALLLSVLLAGVVLNGGPRRSDNQLFFAHSILGALHTTFFAWLLLGDPAFPALTSALLGTVALCWLTTTTLFAWAFPEARPVPARLWVPLVGLTTLASLVRLTTAPDVGIWAFRAAALTQIGLLVFFLWGAQARAGRAAPGVRVVQWVIFARLAISMAGYTARWGTEGPVGLVLGWLEVLLWPALTTVLLALALVRYQLLDVRGFLTRSMGLFVVTTVSGVGMLGLLELSQRILKALDLPVWRDAGLIAPGLLMVLLLAFNPARMRLEGWLERRINRGFVAAREAAARYYRETQGGLDPARLLAALGEATAAILPGGRAAVLLESPRPRLLPAPGFGPLPDASSLCDGPLAALHTPPAPPWVEAPQGAQGPWACQLLIPVAGREGRRGALLLRADAWEVERLDLLREIARTLALQLEVALLYQEALETNAALRQSRDALADTRLYLESVVSSLPVGLTSVDADGRVQQWNPAMARLTGHDAATVLASGALPEAVHALLPPSPAEVPQRRTLTALVDGRPQIRQVNPRRAPVVDNRGAPRGWVLLLSDITELHRLQEEVEASRRLAALGQLAAAMAHEIRTPLTSIKLNVQILASRLVLSERDAWHLDVAQEELERLNRYVAELLDYARPLQLTRAALDLADLAEEVRRVLLFVLAERGVDLVLEPPPPSEGEPPRAEVDGERLKQVLINLIDNASQAAQGRPDAAVRVGWRPVPAGWEIVVGDNGHGMDEATLARIFEPFFTTRPTGTGLGLAIAARIVESHGGALTASSAVGVGSSFRIHLPTTGPAGLADRSTDPMPPLPRKSP